MNLALGEAYISHACACIEEFHNSLTTEKGMEKEAAFRLKDEEIVDQVASCSHNFYNKMAIRLRSLLSGDRIKVKLLCFPGTHDWEVRGVNL